MMFHFARVAGTAILLLVAACQPRVDGVARASDLLATDRAWAQLADTDAPVDTVVGYWTSDARVILPGQPVVVGTEAIRQMVSATRTIPGFHITWTPDSAIVFPGGGVGYTYGTNRITAPDSSGALHTTVGRYVTVWQLEADGRWRCVIDISNEGPLTASPGASR